MNPSNRVNPMPAAAPPPPPAPSGPPLGSKLTPVDPMRVIRKHMLWIIGAGVFGVALGFGLNMMFARFAPQYEARAYIEVLSAPGDPEDVTVEGRSNQEEFDRFRNTEGYKLRQSEILQSVLKHTEIKNTQWYRSRQKLTPGAIERDLLEILSVSTPRETAMIEVRARTRSRNDPSIIVNHIIDEYIEQNRKNMISEVGENEALLTSRRNTLQGEIDLLEDQKNALAQKTEISEIQGTFHETELSYQKLVDARNEVAEMVTSARNNYQSLIAARDQGNVEYTAEEELRIRDDGVIRTINANINGLKQELQIALERFGPGHSVVRNIQYRIDAAETQKEFVRQDLLRKFQDAIISGAKSELARQEATFAKLTEDLEALKQRRAELNAQLRDYKSYEKQLADKRQRLAETDTNLTRLRLLSERKDATRVVIRGRARTPDTHVFPNLKIMIAVSMFGCVGLVVGIAFLKEMLDSRIKSPADAKLLPPNNLLGVIPDAEEDPSGGGQIELAVHHAPSGLIAESFRQLRSEVVRKLDQRHFKTLMITGCSPHSGVSSVTTNLACSIAANGRRVLVIDVNFRRPALAQLLDVDNTAGLGELLSGAASLEQVVHATSIDNLHAIPIGHGDDHILERLESEAFSQALRRLEGAYDLILIDAPPLSIVSDSKLLANRVQAVLLVARAMKEKRGLVSRLIHQFGSGKAELLGLVINAVRTATGGYYRRNFEAFYAYQNGAEAQSPAANGGRSRKRARQTADT